MELWYRDSGNRDICGSDLNLYLSIDMFMNVYQYEIEYYSFILEYTSAINIIYINKIID